MFGILLDSSDRRNFVRYVGVGQSSADKSWARAIICGSLVVANFQRERTRSHFINKRRFALGTRNPKSHLPSSRWRLLSLLPLALLATSSAFVSSFVGSAVSRRSVGREGRRGLSKRREGVTGRSGRGRRANERAEGSNKAPNGRRAAEPCRGNLTFGLLRGFARKGLFISNVFEYGYIVVHKI
jgi:hypothetical protein